MTLLAVGHSIRYPKGYWNNPFGLKNGQRHAGESPRRAAQGEANRLWSSCKDLRSVARSRNAVSLE